MALTKTGICDLGWKSRDFALKGIDGKTYALSDARRPKGIFHLQSLSICESEHRPQRGGGHRPQSAHGSQHETAQVGNDGPSNCYPTDYPLWLGESG